MVAILSKSKASSSLLVGFLSLTTCQAFTAYSHPSIVHSAFHPVTVKHHTFASPTLKQFGNNPLSHLKSPLKGIRSSTERFLSDTENENEDPIFNGKITLTLIGGQSTLIIASIIAALILNTPNLGLGSNFALSSSAIKAGTLATLPLFGLAAFLDLFEDKFKALQDVSKSTQRSVLALLGTKRKPLLAILTAVALGLSAGIGEEMLFRGILQSEIAQRFGDVFAVSITSVIFGALHAVTPLYAILAGIASVFFGYLFQAADFNLAVPIVAHALYDVGALLWAHYAVTALSEEEQMEIYES